MKDGDTKNEQKVKNALKRGGAQPLVRALVVEAARRGDTLAELAKQLGVTYVRLAQWRRQEADIGKAHASVHELAGQYLGIPTVLVLVMAKKVGLLQLVWPATASLTERIGREMEKLRQNPFFGAFVPAELAAASPALQLFVVFLVHEIEGRGANEASNYRWLRALHQAAAGDLHGQTELDELRKQSSERAGIF
ncbi:hypothetical protein [Rhodoferax ferrireducens]|uniref:hypothetical protein n=1 Tax=Rhodoferax ferrireducens TaxID=192843 RepID=UPI000E0D6A2E|nr:hypothetical protein [Rhodoferax ferrireducens]